MEILLVSPYHGGSHQAWADGYKQYSSNQLTLLTLPDRFWKWRMHGGAVTLARRFLAEQRGLPDLILATDMLDLTTFSALVRRQFSQVPLVLYMHENQLTYPLPVDGATGPMRRQLGERDQHYAFINFVSMLTADSIFFNSQFHYDTLFDRLPRFLKHFPEYNELGTIELLRNRSEVLPVGIDFQRLKLNESEIRRHHQTAITEAAPLILWNQRWEYDKNPAAFFEPLYRLDEEKIPFRLVLLGQQYGKRPSFFEDALTRLSDHVIHVGYADEPTYRQFLWEAAVTISTAHHEFFGISILEAIYCQTFPILPHRLSYPELIPEAFHLRCLYQNRDGLVQRLRWALTHPREAKEAAVVLAAAVSRFDWIELAPRYDHRLSAISRSFQ